MICRHCRKRQVNRHCRKRQVNRSRKLCIRCFYTPGILDLYPPSNSKFAHRGVGIGNVRYKSPSEPTDTAPGARRVSPCSPNERSGWNRCFILGTCD